MKTIPLIAMLALAALAVGGNLWAYEGGTKAVVARMQPEKGEAGFNPILLVPGGELSPGKPVQQFLRRIPQPTLSAERIREEKPGRSLGTKAVVVFEGKGR